MRRLLAVLTAFLDEWAAFLDLRTVELRAGIRLIEAVQADEFETKLHMLDPTEAGRQEIRESAILLAQAGIRLDEPTIRQLAQRRNQ